MPSLQDVKEYLPEFYEFAESRFGLDWGHPYMACMQEAIDAEKALRKAKSALVKWVTYKDTVEKAVEQSCRLHKDGCNCKIFYSKPCNCPAESFEHIHIGSAGNA